MVTPESCVQKRGDTLAPRTYVVVRQEGGEKRMEGEDRSLLGGHPQDSQVADLWLIPEVTVLCGF